MIKFSEGFLDHLKSRADLVEIVGRRVPLKKRGRDYVACCPFHQEKSPSFTVSNEKGFYHCFGCGVHGDVVTFIMQTEGLNFPAAVEKLADDLGIPMPRQEISAEAKGDRFLQEILLKIHEVAATFFEQKLQTSLGQEARDYLKKRAVENTIQKKFRLGFSLWEKDSLYQHLKQQGFDEISIRSSGLVIVPQEGEKPIYDKFRGRLMFPIFNEKNQVIAFGGRILGTGEPKYLNSPETLIFKKSFELYNMNFAKTSPLKKEPWVIVEGYMDVITLFQRGYETVVAPLGTALTEHHIAKAWRFCETPILCFDGDIAGKNASMRSAKRVLPFLKPGYSLSFIFLPEGLDPDNFLLLKGVEAFKKLLKDSSVPLVDVLWDSLTHQGSFKTPEEKAMIKNHIKDMVLEIQDATIRDFYQRDLNNRFFETQNSRFFKKPPPMKNPKLWQTKTDNFLKEKVLLAILVRIPSLLEEVEECLVSIEFKDSALRELKTSLLDYYYSEAPLEKLELDHYLRKNSHDMVLEQIFDPSIVVHIPSLERGNIEEMGRDCHSVMDALKRQQSLSGDLEEAKESLKETLNEESWKRFQALKKSFNKDE